METNDVLMLTPSQVADWLGVTTQTLRNWRLKGVEPPSRGEGINRRYPSDEFFEWCKTSRHGRRRVSV